MAKQKISYQEYVFLMRLRSLSAESQELLYDGIVQNSLPESLVSIPNQELHSLLEITAPISIQDHGLLVSKRHFVGDVVASPS